MKKSTLAVFLAFSTAAAQAQAGKWAIGLEGGPSVVSLRGNSAIEDFQNPALSWSGGLLAQRALGGRLYLRTGATLTQKGSRAKLEVTDENGNAVGEATMRNRLSYLSVPVMAGLHLGSGRKYAYVQAGPWVGFLLRQRTSLDGAGLHQEQDNRSLYEKTDFGVAGAAGGFFSLTQRTGLSIELRDEFGLANISKATVAGGGKIRSNALSLLLGVHFAL